jgi:hypothetical protein
MKLFDFHTKEELREKAKRGGKRTGSARITSVRKPVVSEKRLDWKQKKNEPPVAAWASFSNLEEIFELRHGKRESVYDSRFTKPRTERGPNEGCGKPQ